jgi:hypothetical protein
VLLLGDRDALEVNLGVRSHLPQVILDALGGIHAGAAPHGGASVLRRCQ